MAGCDCCSPPSSPLLIGVVGLNGSGKDTFAKFLVDNYNFAHRDLGQEIRDELKRLGKNYLDRAEMIALGNERRQKFGFNYWVKKALEARKPAQNFIVTSVRNPSEVEEIKSRGGCIVETFADIKVRYARTVARVKSDPNAHGDVASFEEFKGKEELELKSADPSKQQNLKCISMADYRLDNNGSVEDFKKSVAELFGKLSK